MIRKSPVQLSLGRGNGFHHALRGDRPDYQRVATRQRSYRATIVSPAGNDGAGRFMGVAGIYLLNSQYCEHKAVQEDARLLETSVGLYPPAQSFAEVLYLGIHFPPLMRAGQWGRGRF